LPENSPRDYLLSGLRSFTFLGTGGAQGFWCHAVLDSIDDANQTVAGSIRWLSETGAVLASAEGAVLRRASEEALREQAAATASIAPSVPRPVFDWAAFESSDREHRLPALCAYLLQEISATTGVPLSRLDGDVPLAEQLDSLMAVEMKMRIESNLRVEVPIAAFVDGQSTRQAAARLLDAMHRNGHSAPQADDELGGILASIEDLSEEDAQTLLKQSASAGGGFD
jgi:hypothetical protein